MGHLGAPHWVDLLGLLAGSVGVSIAIWLQMITPRVVKARYILGFLTLGCSLMLINLEPLIPNTDAVLAARVLAYLTLVAAQAYLAYHVWDESELQPVKGTKDWLFDENGGKH